MKIALCCPYYPRHEEFASQNVFAKILSKCSCEQVYKFFSKTLMNNCLKTFLFTTKSDFVIVDVIAGTEKEKGDYASI